MCETIDTAAHSSSVAGRCASYIGTVSSYESQHRLGAVDATETLINRPCIGRVNPLNRDLILDMFALFLRALV